MAKPCGICIHDSRLAIEQAILNGKPLTQIARQFGITYTSAKGAEVGDHKAVQRHRDNHMAAAYQAAVQDREVKSGQAMADRLAQLEAEVDKVIARANEGEVVMVGDVPLLDDEGREMRRYDSRLLLAAVREARGNVELLAKLAGAIPEGKAEELDAIRRRLENPQTRRLLAMLDELDAQDDASVSRSGE